MTPKEVDAMWSDWQNTLALGQGSKPFIERWGLSGFCVIADRARSGDAHALFLLAKCHELGIAVPASDIEAHKYYLQSAEAGFLWAMLNLADCYEFGLGVAPDPNAAIHWLERAIDIDSTGDSHFQLASLYSRLEDQELGMPKKVRYLRQANDLGHLEAKKYLAAHLWHEQLSQAEQLEGCQLMHEAAKSGSAIAQNDLAVAYQYGKWPIQKDMAKAIDWYKLSADQDCAIGCHNLGQCYFNGWGVERDLKLAFKWITKAAQQEHPQAQYDLAMLYLFHFDEPKEGLSQSIPWLRRAVENGLTEYAEMLKTLELTHARNTSSSQQDSEAIR